MPPQVARCQASSSSTLSRATSAMKGRRGAELAHRDRPTREVAEHSQHCRSRQPRKPSGEAAPARGLLAPRQPPRPLSGELLHSVWPAGPAPALPPPVYVATVRLERMLTRSLNLSFSPGLTTTGHLGPQEVMVFDGSAHACSTATWPLQCTPTYTYTPSTADDIETYQHLPRGGVNTF